MLVSVSVKIFQTVKGTSENCEGMDRYRVRGGEGVEGSERASGDPKIAQQKGLLGCP